MSLPRRLAVGAGSFGGTLLVVAALIAGLGPTHEELTVVQAGHVHVHSVATGWFYAAVIVGIVGFVLAVVGGIVLAVTGEQARVGDNHAKTLERALATAENSVSSGKAVVFGTKPNDQLGQTALPLHFKRLKIAKRWEPHVVAYEAAVVTLQAKVEDVATEREIVEPQCDHDYICSTASAIVKAQAREDKLGTWTAFLWGGHEADGVFTGAPKGDPNQGWIRLAATEGTSASRLARSEVLRDRINGLISDAQAFPEAAAVRDEYQRMTKAREGLIKDIHLIRERWPPKKARKCEGCDDT
jgi:hypothetical protein